MIDNDSIINLDTNLKDIYDEICELDREFNKKMNDSSTSDNCYLREIIYRTCEIDNKMVMLSSDERIIMAQMLAELISNIDGRISIVLSSLYEAICYLSSGNSKKLSCHKK